LALGLISSTAKTKPENKYWFSTDARKKFVFEVLGFEVGAYTLSHSTGPVFLCWVFLR
jgi:hypothetical protein